MSAQSLMKRPPVVALAIVTGAVLIGGLFAASRGVRRTQEAVVQVPADSSVQQAAAKLATPKVGDLQVTQEAMQLAEIKLAPATARVVAEKLPTSGVVEAGGDRVIKVTPRVAGKVVSVSAVVGDAVRAGQTVALIESTELAQAQAAYRQAVARVTVARTNLERQRQLARLGVFSVPRVEEARRAAIDAEGEVSIGENQVIAARAAAREAESELGALRALLAQAQTQVKVVKSRMDRADLLLKEELISRQDWEQAQADYQRAEADVEVAQANLNQGEAKVETARAELKAAQAKLGEARKRVRIAEQALKREQAVYKGGYATSQEMVEAEAALQQAELDQQAAAQAVRLLGARPGGGSIIPLTTAIAGRVQERNVSPGETVDTEHALFTVINLNQVWAQLAVAPKDLPLVRTGQRVELTAETMPGRVFKGTISAIGSTTDETTRMVRVRTALANPGDVLRPGAFVRGSIVTDVRRERVVVPNGALQEHTGKPTLYVAKEGHPGAFEVRHVKLGVRGGGWREVAAGLKTGEPVAVSGTFYLKSEALKSSLSDGCCAPSGGK